MNKGSFICVLLITLFLASTASAQRGSATTLPSAADRRNQRDQYNRRMNDPANNPYLRGEEAVARVIPGQIPTGAVLRLEPPKRSFLETEISEVLDGDTVAINNAQNQRVLVRLVGIDAPELGQDFGLEAKTRLAEKIAGKKVRLAFEPHGVPDEAGRILAKIFLDERDIAAEQVGEGFAWYYESHKERLGYVEIDELKQLQSTARKGKMQLWQNRSPQAPWKFRKKAA